MRSLQTRSRSALRAGSSDRPPTCSVPEEAVELIDLGFDGWFQERATELRQPDHRVARVAAVVSRWWPSQE